VTNDLSCALADAEAAGNVNDAQVRVISAAVSDINTLNTS